MPPRCFCENEVVTGAIVIVTIYPLDGLIRLHLDGRLCSSEVSAMSHPVGDVDPYHPGNAVIDSAGLDVEPCHRSPSCRT